MLNQFKLRKASVEHKIPLLRIQWSLVVVIVFDSMQEEAVSMDRETQNQSQFIYGRYIKSTSIHGLSGACTETNRVSNAPLNGRTTGSSPIPISMQCRPLRRPLAQTRIDIIPQFFLESGRWLSVLYVHLINERAPLLHSKRPSLLRSTEMDGCHLHSRSRQKLLHT